MPRTPPVRRVLPAALLLCFAGLPTAASCAGSVRTTVRTPGADADAAWRTHAFAPLRVAGADPAPSGTTVITVTNCNDAGPGSLRQAMLDAHDSTRIEFAMTCSKITLTTNSLLDPNVDSLRIVAPLRTVDGRPQPSITIDAAGRSSVIEHRSTGALELQGLALVNGHTLATNTESRGGCVYSIGRVVATGVTISGCVAEARSGGAAVGGGIWSKDIVGLVHSRISGNTALSVSSGAYSYGGGVFASRGLYAVFSSIDANRATAFGYGGGVAVRGPVAILHSSIVGNSGAVGGGLGLFGGPNLDSGDIYLANSTVAHNSATVFAAGIEASSELHVHNSTIAGNTGPGGGRGNGIVFEGLHPLTLVSTIVHGNTTRDIEDPTAISGNANLVGTSNVALPAGTLRTDPRLGTLAFHGGLTPTFDLQAGSPAIDAGDNPLELPCDQRGGVLLSLENFTMIGRHERLVGARADIGAFESGAGDRRFHSGFEFAEESCFRQR